MTFTPFATNDGYKTMIECKSQSEHDDDDITKSPYR